MSLYHARRPRRKPYSGYPSDPGFKGPGLTSRDAADAIKELSSAIKAAPDNVDILFTSARVHELAGDRTRAIDAIREALRRGYAPSEVNNEPDLTGLRSDPRFLKLVSGAGKGGRQQP